MNTIPSRREIIITSLVLLLIIAAWLVDSLRHLDNINGDMHVVATMVNKDLHPELYPRDVNYATDELYRFYTPVYRWLLARLWQLTGQFELGLVLLMPFVLGTYLLGMYGLSRKITANPWLALGVTVASAAYFESMGEEIWGSGGSNLMLARTLLTATVPYLTILMLDIWQNPRLSRMVGLGLGIGLVANLHPPSGMHLAVMASAIFVLVQLFSKPYRFQQTYKVSLNLIAMNGAILVGVWPTLANYRRGTAQTNLGTVPFQKLYGIVSEWYDMPFRPLSMPFPALNFTLTTTYLEVMFWFGLSAGLMALSVYLFAPRWYRWLWLIGGLLAVWYAFTLALFNLVIIFALVACYIIYRFQRNSYTTIDSLLVAWAAFIVAQAFMGYYLISKLWHYSELTGLTTLVGEQPRAARFIYLPIYLLVGLAGVALVQELAKRWRKIEPEPTEFSVAIGLLIALSPGLSTVLMQNLLAGLVGLLVTGLALIGLTWAITKLPSYLLLPTSYLLLILIFFGPLATIFAPYLHIPAVNLLDPTARAAKPAFKSVDQDLYAWTKTHTKPDALFFWCEFGPITTLHFRLKAERSLTHNWRDLNQRTYNPGTLVTQYEHYRQYERACRTNPLTALAKAKEAGADFILAPRNFAVEFESTSCFLNDRYAVFPVQAPCQR